MILSEGSGNVRKRGAGVVFIDILISDHIMVYRPTHKSKSIVKIERNVVKAYGSTASTKAYKKRKQHWVQ